MLDYEIITYKVVYYTTAGNRFTKYLNQEEEAIEFAKANRKGWINYCIMKAQRAIIDF